MKTKWRKRTGDTNVIPGTGKGIIYYIVEVMYMQKLVDFMRRHPLVTTALGIVFIIAFPLLLSLIIKTKD